MQSSDGFVVNSKAAAAFCCAAAFALLLPNRALPESGTSDARSCVPGQAGALKQNCDTQITAQVQSGSRIRSLAGGWQLVRTNHPSGGPDAVSAMHVVDTANSDTGLAGLSLQCAEHGIEVLLVTLEHLAKGARLRVVMTASDGAPTEMEGSVAQSGESLSLPQQAASLAAGEWQKSARLFVQIEKQPVPMHGEIPIAGLDVALQTLKANCPQPQR